MTVFLSNSTGNGDPNHGDMFSKCREALIDCGVVTFAFWSSSHILQRMFGALPAAVRLHAGRSFGATVVAGAISCSACLVGSQQLLDLTRPRHFLLQQDQQVSTGLPFSHYFGREARQQRAQQRSVLKRTLASFALFVLLEQRAFRTSLPSSILTIGVFAKPFHSAINSVPATSAVATEGERRKIQRLGKLAGCHQCGSRQLGSRSIFIADHMPPTKIANEWSNVWWRKLLRLEVVQRLYPQCQKCFSIQGAAVKKGLHLPVYHNSLRIYHWAPALALLALRNQDLNDVTGSIADDCEALCRRCVKEMSNLFPF